MKPREIGNQEKLGSKTSLASSKDNVDRIKLGSLQILALVQLQNIQNY